LLETELRGIIKGLLDALVYLKKEFVIHCNITPSNILLTNDHGVVSVNVHYLADSLIYQVTQKLSGFDYAIRLQAIESLVSDSISLRCSGHPQYLAP
jgi:polo-like kinase 4